MKRYILPLIAAVGAQAAVCQNLRTEITVDRTVQPDIRESHRPNGINATIINPEFTVKKPAPAEYTATGALTGDLSRLPITPWADSIAHTPYRGYVNLGYFPTFNANLSAGYNFLNNERANAGLWLQYNGYSYNADMDRFDQALFANNFATLGVNSQFRTSSVSSLTANIEFTYGIVRNPYYNVIHTNKDEFVEQRRSFNQNSYGGKLYLDWTLHQNRVYVDLHAGAEYFGLGDNLPELINPSNKTVEQKGGNIGVGLGYCYEDSSSPWLGIDMDWTILNSSRLPYEYTSIFSPQPLTGYHDATMVQGRFTPYVRFGNDYLMGRAGLNVDIAKGNERSQLKFSPAVSLEFQPASFVSIHGVAQGGQYINRMSELYQLNPYMLNYQAYERSYTPLLTYGGIDVTPLKGLTISGHIGFAIAKDYLLPQVTTQSTGLQRSLFCYDDINSLYYGGQISYNLSRWFNISAGAHFGHSDSDYNSWYDWRDGAKRVIDGSLTVHPIPNIDINVSYQLRSGRRIRTLTYPYLSVFQDAVEGVMDAGDVSDLCAGATYRITPALTVFANVDNILGSKYRLISGMPCQPLNGLIGVGYKF